jgi:hypothetical protein
MWKSGESGAACRTPFDCRVQSIFQIARFERLPGIFGKARSDANASL